MRSRSVGSPYLLVPFSRDVGTCQRLPTGKNSAHYTRRGALGYCVRAIIRGIVRLGDPYGGSGARRRIYEGSPAKSILREIELGGHNLLVLGVSPSPGEQLYLGKIAAELLERAECSILFVASEPLLATPPESPAVNGVSSSARKTA